MLRMPWVKCRISFGSRWCEGFLPGCYSRRRSLWPSSPKALRRLCPNCARENLGPSRSNQVQPRVRFKLDAGSPYIPMGYGATQRPSKSCGPKGPCGFDGSPSLCFGSLVRRRSRLRDFGAGPAREALVAFYIFPPRAVPKTPARRGVALVARLSKHETRNPRPGVIVPKVCPRESHSSSLEPGWRPRIRPVNHRVINLPLPAWSLSLALARMVGSGDGRK
jgi:hypothetical protein